MLAAGADRRMVAGTMFGGTITRQVSRLPSSTLVIEPDGVTLGCRAAQAGVSTVVSLKVDVYLAEENKIAVRIRKARAGNLCEDIALVFCDVLKKYGITKDNRAGYAIGLSYPPDWGERTMSLRDGDKTELRPGMTFHFMTGLWMDDWGMETTESIVITGGAPECLASVPRKLFIKA